MAAEATSWDRLGALSTGTVPEVDRYVLSETTDAQAVSAFMGSAAAGLGTPAELARAQAEASEFARALGVIEDGQADADDVREIARRLEVEIGEPLSPATIEVIRLAYAQQTKSVLRDLGISRLGPVSVADVRMAGDLLGIDIGDIVGAGDMDRIMAAHNGLTPEDLDALAAPYLDALGIPYGAFVDEDELHEVADLLDLRLRYDGRIGQDDISALHAAFLQRAIPVMNGFDIDYGRSVDDQDLRALAAALGADLGSGIEPAEVDRLLALAERHTETPPPIFATIDGVEMHVPSRSVKLVGFHESSSAAATPMDDHGHRISTVLPTRDRGTPSTSAVDVAVTPGTTVLSPVSGTVVAANEYLLYGEHPDEIIRIRPDDNPDSIITVIHVTGRFVESGDHIEAGQPLADHSTIFPFQSQIDRFAGRGPHVHIEGTAA